MVVEEARQFGKACQRKQRLSWVLKKGYKFSRSRPVGLRKQGEGCKRSTISSFVNGTGIN